MKRIRIYLEEETDRQLRAAFAGALEGAIHRVEARAPERGRRALDVGLRRFIAGRFAW